MAENQQQNDPVNPDEVADNDDDFETIGEGEDNDDIEFVDDEIINQMDELADQNEEAIEHTDEESKHMSESGDDSFHIVDMSWGVFREHGDHIYTLAQHPTKNNIILSGGGDDRVLAWDMLTDEKEKQTLFEVKEGFKDSIEYIRFNHDGKYLLITGQGNPIRIYKVKEGIDETQFEFKKEMETGDDITFITWHQKSNFFLTGGNDMMVWMFNALTGEFMTYTGHEDIVNNAIFSPNGKKIVSISNDATVKIWDPITTKWLNTIRDDKSFHQYPITSIGMHGETIVTGDSEGYIYISQIKTGEWVGPITKCNEVIEQIVSWNSNQVWGSIDGSVRIIDTGTQSVGINFNVGSGVTKIVVPNESNGGKQRPNSKYLGKDSKPSDKIYVATTTGTILWIDSRSGETLKTYTAHHDSVMDFIVDETRKKIVSVGDDKIAFVFDI